MQITSYRTPKIHPGERLLTILDQYLPKLQEKDIVAVTSKIVSLGQGRVVKNHGQTDKTALIKKEADYYIDDENLLARYHLMLTLKDNLLIPNSGIDESNGHDHFILWPKEIHRTAAEIWDFLRGKYQLKHLGIVITDSHTQPLRWGTTGIGLSWCGFTALKNYIGQPDLFGRKLRVTKQSVLDGLAAAATLVMGEGAEQTPLAVIRSANFVEFQDRPPTKKEISALRIGIKDDIYAPLVNCAKWTKGGSSRKI